MRRVLMVAALFLGTTVMMNANTIPAKANTSKSVKTTVVRKHKKHRKTAAKTTAAAKPVAPAQK